jgi:fatty-acyl-CoA synthase
MPEFALAQLFNSVANAVPDREALRFESRGRTYRELDTRARALATTLRSLGLGTVRPRSELQNWESGQDHVALYLCNGPEYIEAMLGCFAARTVPCNVNYRYTERELVSLLGDMRARALVFDSEFAPIVQSLRGALPELEVLIQVSAVRSDPLLPGAVDYEAAAQSGAPIQLPDPSPDDLDVLYTGGKTGTPKGVAWRQADVYIAAFGGRDLAGAELPDLESIASRAAQGVDRVMPLSPFMHGAAHWNAFYALLSGETVVLQDGPRKFDAERALATAARERVSRMQVIGDAFGRPLVDALERRSHSLPALRVIINGGAPLSVATKRALLERLPECAILDAVGASESGTQAVHISAANNVATGRFARVSTTCVLDSQCERELAPGDPEIGWFAQRGRVPLGYLYDAEKTRRTFPTIGGARFAVPGDRAKLLADGTIEFLGRDSSTINSGGEKIFAEEVEAVLKQHPAVYDALVCGRPHERWGEEVCAVVQLRPDHDADQSELGHHVSAVLARYKVPRTIVFCEQVERTPAGKPNYAWARSRVMEVKS